MPRAKKIASPTSPTLVRTAASRKRPADTLPDIAPEAIAQRAYELFIADGGQHGRDLEHWLRAEAEVRQGRALSRAS